MDHMNGTSKKNLIKHLSNLIRNMAEKKVKWLHFQLMKEEAISGHHTR
jgi:hypothetical protein